MFGTRKVAVLKINRIFAVGKGYVKPLSLNAMTHKIILLFSPLYRGNAMKKFCLIILFALAACSGIQAQRPVGDTLWPPVDTDYFYAKHLGWFYNIPDNFDTNWMTDYYDQFLGYQGFADQMHVFAFFDGNHIAGNQLYAEYPIKVVGIAICAHMEQPRDTTINMYMDEYNRILRGIYHYRDTRQYSDESFYFFPTVDDTTMKGRLTDSVILYRPKMTADGPDLERLAAAPWRMEQPHRYIHMPLHHAEVYHYNVFDSIVCPLYEVMFDSAVVLDGSFVVASTAFNNEGDWFTRTVLGNSEYMWLWEHPATRFYVVRNRNPIIPCDTTCCAWMKYRDQRWLRFLGCNDTVKIAYPFFPIIELGFDTTLCHEVSNLRVAERGAGSATLMWDAGDGGPWIVAYGRYDDAWEDFTFDTVGSPMVTLTGLEVGTQYFALVRGYCSVTEEYGEWSSPLEVEIFQPGHEEPEGIDRPGDLGRFTRLVPNPARGEVNVVSSFRLSRIEHLHDGGREQPAKRHLHSSPVPAPRRGHQEAGGGELRVES